MIKWLNNELADCKEFGLAWYQFVFKRGYRAFRWFEAAKGWLARLLYRQRGRFSQPFLHISMAGLVALAIALAPVLVGAFPGVGSDPTAGESPSNVVRELTVDSTSTVISDKVRDRVEEYTVVPGDTISKIAANFGVDTDTLRWANNLSSVDAIKPGQSLKIPPVSGVVHKVARGETVYSIAKKYSASAQAIVDFPFNSFTDDETFSLSVGQDLVVPDGKMPNVIPWSPSLYVAQTTPNAGSVTATGQFIWPLGGVITQRFAWYHKGLDIATAYGTPILAADSGRVIVAGWPDNTGYGNRVVIDHGNGFVTLYAHLSKILVGIGQTVKRGDQIGLEGSTGRSTGPHLHFEIRRGGLTINPGDYLR
jgi:murein DD-endopeptidase MepM/ murein hydrolase activator NlpD